MYAFPSLSMDGPVIKATGCPGVPNLKKAFACHDLGEISCLIPCTNLPSDHYTPLRSQSSLEGSFFFFFFFPDFTRSYLDIWQERVSNHKYNFPRLLGRKVVIST